MKWQRPITICQTYKHHHPNIVRSIPAEITATNAYFPHMFTEMLSRLIA